MLCLLREESMNAALDLVEPGPASGAFILTIGGLARAGPASDRTIALVLQRIVRDFVLANVFPNRVAIPIGHRVQLHDLAPGGFIKQIDFNDANFTARGGLFAAQPGDPAIDVTQLILERQNFAHRAAEVRIALPKFGTMRLCLLLNGQIGMERLDLVAEI